MQLLFSGICESYLLTFCSHFIRYLDLSINMSKNKLIADVSTIVLVDQHASIHHLSGRAGRPRFMIPSELLLLLIENNFTAPSEVRGVT